MKVHASFRPWKHSKPVLTLLALRVRDGRFTIRSSTVRLGANKPQDDRSTGSPFDRRRCRMQTLVPSAPERSRVSSTRIWAVSGRITTLVVDNKCQIQELCPPRLQELWPVRTVLARAVPGHPLVQQSPSADSVNGRNLCTEMRSVVRSSCCWRRVFPNNGSPS